MQHIAIIHRTTYRSTFPIGLCVQNLMLAPRPDQSLRIVEHSVDIAPSETVQTYWDQWNNPCQKIEWQDPPWVTEYSIISKFTAFHNPQSYDEIRRACNSGRIEQDSQEVLDAKQLQYSEYSAGLEEWLHQALGSKELYASDFDQFCALSNFINKNFTYAARYSHGSQPPEVTLQMKSGACRDYAILLMESARLLGFAARFTSGYSYTPGEVNLTGQSTHAWTQIYLPGAGWIDFDPTNCAYGGECVIPCAVTLHHRDNVPISGSFIPSSKDCDYSMEVDVCATIHTVKGPRLVLDNSIDNKQDQQLEDQYPELAMA